VNDRMSERRAQKRSPAFLIRCRVLAQKSKANNVTKAAAASGASKAGRLQLKGQPQDGRRFPHDALLPRTHFALQPARCFKID